MFPHDYNHSSPSKSTYTSQPAAEVISYSDAKAQIRLDSDYEYDYITRILIPGTRSAAETQMNTTLVTRTVEAIYWFQNQRYYLPKGPIQSITSIVDGTGTTIDPSTYQLRAIGVNDYVYFIAGLPTIQPNGITITYQAGYGIAANVPHDIVMGLLQHIAQLYSNRESATSKQQYAINGGLETLYQPYMRGINAS